MKNDSTDNWKRYAIIQIAAGILVIICGTSTSWSNPTLPFWDYEGFSFFSFFSVLFGIVFISLGLLSLYQKRSIRRKIEKGGSSNTFMFLQLLIISGFMLIFFSDKLPQFQHLNLKYHLPLQKINTVDLEGTLTQEAAVLLIHRPNKYDRVSSSFFLKEYPNIHFSYQNKSSHPLRDEIINIGTDDIEKYNAIFKGLEKAESAAKGSNVSIKIRKEDFENMHELVDDNPFKNSIDFYELSVNDEILLQKFGIK